MKRRKPGVVWCDRGWMPSFYGFCPDEASWHAELKRLGVEPEPYPSSSGRVTAFTNKKTGALCQLVTITDVEKHLPIEIIGLLAHEGMHVWRHIRENIDEAAPSCEFEAYALQAIVQSLIDAYEKTRGRLCLRRPT